MEKGKEKTSADGNNDARFSGTGEKGERWAKGMGANANKIKEFIGRL